jgi:segregation and condensation protein B
MEEHELKNIVEAILLSSSKPMHLDQIWDTFDEWQKPSLVVLKTVIEQLIIDYAPRAFELIQVATGYQIQTKAKYSYWILKLQIEKSVKYSRALLETLAIIAYKQPVTRADIEEIRGVAVSSQIIKTLLEREWIRVAGYKDTAGKPAVFCTTKSFLNYFNLSSLNELPILPDVIESSQQANQPTKECNTE